MSTKKNLKGDFFFPKNHNFSFHFLITIFIPLTSYQHEMFLSLCYSDDNINGKVLRAQEIYKNLECFVLKALADGSKERGSELI